MATAFRTSPAGKGVIKFFEGCAKPLPDGRLIAYRPSKRDNPTIGWGCEGYLFPGTPGQIKIVDGLIITQQQADDAFEFFLVNVVEPLVNSHFNPETQGEFDALVSWCWNIRHDKLNRGEYSLPEVFNRKPRDFEAIVEWWIKYVNPNTEVEQGLYRRRLAELCLMFGWPWKFATSAVLKRVNGVIQERTDPDYILKLAEAAAETAKAAPLPPPPPKATPAARPAPDTPPPPVKTEPKPVAVGTKPASPNTKKPEEVPYRIDPNAGLKPLEETDRGKGFFWQQAAVLFLRITGLGTFGTGAAQVANIVQSDAALSGALFNLTIPLLVLITGVVVSFVMKSYGDWKRKRGEETATQGMY